MLKLFYEELLLEGLQKGLIRAKKILSDELLEADIVMIAVATPSFFNGSLQLDHMMHVFETIKASIAGRKRKLIVAIRSTIHPHALKEVLQKCKIEQESHLSIVVNPEFLRESTAINDFFHPPFCVVGGTDKDSVQKVISLYQGITSKQYSLSLEASCLLKYACNAFHAMKIAFANEIGAICETLVIDPVEIMHVFCQDHLLNCSSAYLKPGFSFGGSCLPKDLRALLSLGREIEQELPLLSAILSSNRHRFQSIVSQIMQQDHNQLAIIGLSFKKNNDDLRESPYVELVEFLIGKGIKVKIFDPDVKVDRLMGSNLKAFERQYRHLIPLIKENLEEVLENCDGIIFCKNLKQKEILAYRDAKDLVIYDLHYHLSSTQKSMKPILSA